MSVRPIAGVALAAALLAAGLAMTRTPGGAAVPDGAAADPANWAQFGRTAGSQGYSPLRKVDAANVKALGLAWSYDLPAGHHVTAPVEADGRLYVISRVGAVTALDAAAGKLLWTYDPGGLEAAGDHEGHTRGIRALSYDQGRVFLGTLDGRLIALDGKTGKPLWSVQTTTPGDARYITGPPRPFNGKVVIGHGGGDYVGARGYVTCYDAATGRQLWRFYTVPGNPAGGFEDPSQAMAAKTWSGDWWKYGAGGAVWHAITYDRDFNRVYIGTGNAEPYNRGIRSQNKGDNLFSASIVALEADSGKYLWHYQVNPGEEWDYDASMDIQLATLTIGGKVHKVLMQAPKNGFFYVIDRADGKLISAGQIGRENWADRIDIATGRPVELEGIHFHKGKAFQMWPSGAGAHNWLPGAFNPMTRLIYMPITDRTQTWDDPTGDTMGFQMSTPGLVPGERSFLKAWDPVTQKAAWQVDLPNAESGGVMTTAGGLVFQGSSDRTFDAYDARTGTKLWSFDAKVPLAAPPITYEVNGVQYLTIVTGYRGAGVSAEGPGHPMLIDYRAAPPRVLTFALGGKGTLPALPPVPPLPAPDPDFNPDPARLQRGAAGYGRCFICHGAGAVGLGLAPDLRYSPIVHSAQAFATVVHDGPLVRFGMPRYGELTPDQLEDIRLYLLNSAQDSAAAAHIAAQK